mgnify:CR=1 FL=1
MEIKKKIINIFIGDLDKNLYEEIVNCIELAKKYDKEVSALDGSAWSIEQYKNGKTVWMRKMGYIYGIEPLEKIGKIMNGLIGK